MNTEPGLTHFKSVFQSLQISGLLQHFCRDLGEAVIYVEQTEMVSGGGEGGLSTSTSEYPVLGFSVNPLNHYLPQKHIQGLINIK